MTEITYDIPAEQAEYLRQNLAAMALFAMAEGDAAKGSRKFGIAQKLKSILQCIDMLDPGAKPDWPSCTGCGKAIGFKAEYVTYSGDDDSFDFCVACDPQEGAPRQIAHDPGEADRDIERAKAWLIALMQEGGA